MFLAVTPVTNAENVTDGICGQPIQPSNPTKQDSDNDGINDKGKVDQGRNPAVDERVITLISILMELLK